MLEIGTQTHPSPHQDAIFLLLHKGNVLISQSEHEAGQEKYQHTLYDFQPDASTNAVYCGQWQQQDLFVCLLTKVPKGFLEIDLRELLFNQDEAGYLLISRARQLATWDKDHQYCSRCSTPLKNKHDREHTKICPKCNHRSYPRISPCIIVSIRKGDSILLARGMMSPPGRYSNIAGFVEAGETLEQAVAREVEEEVGIRVKNVTYHSSQPWSFPHQLMTGFLAEYDSGEITPAPGEIDEADWFEIDALPEIPSTATISGQIIVDHIKHIKSEKKS
ncbi:phosphohydrolase [Marinomonas sp. SBI22]|uniref:NAD(+) diphosphatase n=1 Tax=unclassified Marinomonas TaxID=196814 RepID=UPI0007AF1A35|nr:MULTISPECIES: NAD(+) diphosphatase [unclassified Marinomonas]KZM42980.1 phosphohydrolase [Marinomonas sp. SBI22]KZM44550.1 phosphohydrolase [Marinomonas sp. SBI8L]